MTLYICLSGIIGLLPLIMLIFLCNTKIKSGKSLMKAKSLDAVLFFIFGVVCFIVCLCTLYFKKNDGYIFYAVPLLLLSIYFISYAVTSINCITENGIIILDSFAHLIKWSEIQAFGVNGKKIYIKSTNRYVSIDFSDNDIKNIEKVIRREIEG